MLIGDGERELSVIGQIVKDAPRVPLLFVGVVQGLEIVGTDTGRLPCIIGLLAHENFFCETSEAELHGIAVKCLEIVHALFETGTADAAQLLDDYFFIWGECVGSLCNGRNGAFSFWMYWKNDGDVMR